MFLGVDQDKSGRIGFFESSGGTSGFGLQIGTVPTRSGRLASMYIPVSRTSFEVLFYPFGVESEDHDLVGGNFRSRVNVPR